VAEFGTQNALVAGLRKQGQTAGAPK